MSTNLYDQFVPVLIKYMKNLSHLLDKGASFCEGKGLDQQEFLAYRLISDMRGLDYQVQSCSNTCKFALGRLGLSVPVFPDTETTIPELQTRIRDTIALLESVDPAAINGKEKDEVLMVTKSMGSYRFDGQRYISEYILPNFHFHLTSAYCIMRTQGVPVGALDYMRDVFEKIEEA